MAAAGAERILAGRTLSGRTQAAQRAGASEPQVSETFEQPRAAGPELIRGVTETEEPREGHVVESWFARPR